MTQLDIAIRGSRWGAWDVGLGSEERDAWGSECYYAAVIGVSLIL